MAGSVGTRTARRAWSARVCKDRSSEPKPPELRAHPHPLYLAVLGRNELNAPTSSRRPGDPRKEKRHPLFDQAGDRVAVPTFSRVALGKVILQLEDESLGVRRVRCLPCDDDLRPLVRRLGTSHHQTVGEMARPLPGQAAINTRLGGGPA